jgi:hypothetical protein
MRQVPVGYNACALAPGMKLLDELRTYDNRMNVMGPLITALYPVAGAVQCSAAKLMVFAEDVEKEGVSLATAIKEIIVSRALQEASDGSQWQKFTELLDPSGSDLLGMKLIPPERVADAQASLINKFIAEVARSAAVHKV